MTGVGGKALPTENSNDINWDDLPTAKAASFDPSEYQVSAKDKRAGEGLVINNPMFDPQQFTAQPKARAFTSGT